MVTRGRQLGLEVDCVGLVIMVGLNTGVLELPEKLDSAFTGYGLLPNPLHLRRALDTYLAPVVGDHQDADVGFFALDGLGYPIHLAIMATYEGRPSMIHAHANQRRPRVVETGYTAGWPAWCHGFWRYPGLA